MYLQHQRAALIAQRAQFMGQFSAEDKVTFDDIVSGLRRLHPTFRRVLVGCDGTSRTQASASPALQRAAVAAGFDRVQRTI